MTTRKQKLTKPFPTQKRLHELFDMQYDEAGNLYFLSLVDRWGIKKGQKLYGYEAVCNKKFPSAHTRRFLGIDGHVQQIAVYAYIFAYGDYDRKGNVVDHIDNNPNNNHISNLRVITAQENSRRKSRQKNSFSEFKGITWNKNAKRWLAMIRVDGKSMYIGVYKDEKEAARAYDDYASLYFGEFANLNFSV